MTVHVMGRRGTYRRLRELEESISAQRRFVASLEGRHLDATDERKHLAQLLSELDLVLAECATIEGKWKSRKTSLASSS